MKYSRYQEDQVRKKKIEKGGIYSNDDFYLAGSFLAEENEVKECW